MQNPGTMDDDPDLPFMVRGGCRGRRGKHSLNKSLLWARHCARHFPSTTVRHRLAFIFLHREEGPQRSDHSPRSENKDEVESE